MIIKNNNKEAIVKSGAGGISVVFIEGDAVKLVKKFDHYGYAVAEALSHVGASIIGITLKEALDQTR